MINLLRLKNDIQGNILDISLTFEVLKFDKFNDIKEFHPTNIALISVSDEVSKFDKSIAIKKSQSRNIF